MLPCYTEPQDGDRTIGQMQTLMKTLQGIDEEQGGDATLPQLEMIRTQAAVAQARMQAQLVEMEASRVERTNRRSILAAQRRATARARQLADHACQLNNGIAGQVDVRWKAVGVRPLPDGGFNVGRCVRVN